MITNIIFNTKDSQTKQQVLPHRREDLGGWVTQKSAAPLIQSEHNLKKYTTLISGKIYSPPLTKGDLGGMSI